MQSLHNFFLMLMLATSCPGWGQVLVGPARQAWFAGEEVKVSIRPGEEWEPQGALIAVLRLESATLWQQTVQEIPPFTLTIQLPELRPGMVQRFDLLVAVRATGDVLLRHPLYLFGRPLTAGLTAALRKEGIGAWAPDTPSLYEMLDDLAIPYERVLNPAAFGGHWLIVAGLDLEQEPGMLPILYGLAQRGTSVLVMPPLAGPVRVPDTVQVLAAGAERLPEIDKRLDAEAWSDAAPVAVAYADLRALDAGAAFLFSTNPGAWSWLELRSDTATVIFCGYDLLAHYRHHPAPGWLLLNLFVPRELQVQPEADPIY